MKYLRFLLAMLTCMLLLLTLTSCSTCPHVTALKRESETSATCSVAGSYVEVKYCVDCGEELSREEKTSAPLEHTPSDWLVDVAPTCASVGTKYIACTVCEKRLQVDQIPATEQHRPSEAGRENVKDATCDVLGSYEEVITCLDCSRELFRAQKEIPMLPHTPSDWIVDTDSTCSKVGVKHKECTVCDAMLETDEVYFKAHTPSDTFIENSVDARRATTTRSYIAQNVKKS